MIGRAVIRAFARDESGATAVEAALLSGVFIVLVGGGLEMGLAYHQHNAAQQAARHGARLAATGDPIARKLTNLSGLGGGVSAGDPLPDYLYACDGAARSCTQGGYDTNAMERLVHGPDRTGCADTERRLQGMCDFVDGLDASNVRVSYAASGLGTAGRPADPVPLITVTVTDMDYDFVFLDRLLPGVREMGDVSASVIAENLGG